MSALAALFALAVAPLAEPQLERRAQALEQEIRCVRCENEPISQSTAEIAADMRREVRERLAAGESDGQVRDYFRERYGPFVLYRPPAEGGGLWLWLAPIFALAGALGFWAWRTRASSGDQTPEEGER